uniref:Putative NB-ARC n=1 Tax=Helianthus annuus TaxID=4232 RepID=A0A251SYN2_HELAN
MAEAAAAALVKVIFDKLADEAFKRYARSQNIHSELKQLGITLTQIQALLNDASHKETTHESVRLWLSSLQHLAYDIDDVLDDVATEAMHRELTPESEASTSMYEEWENLVRPFHSGATGSRVIMTTRKQQLLKKIGFNHLDHLDRLSHEDALSLLALHALDVDNFDSHATLKSQAEGIVEKCGCLPLAIKAIGRLLRTKTDGEEWDDVLNSEIWDLETANEIVPALRLSYHDLSADLKRLFAYCSLFPKDFLFEKEELVLLWVAEGYLNESVANKSPECLGHECFEKLLSRSFFQCAPSGDPFFVMHDLMNDLATFVAGEYFLRFDNQMKMEEEALAKYRHMSFVREKYVAFQKFRAFEKARSLRTLLAVYVGVDQDWKQFYLSSKILVDLLPQLPLLRVLSLRRFNISEVPNSIGTLKHLRYLNLSQTKIKELPENVGNLYNLQTLIVSGCESLTNLPKSFFKLKRLRHFDIRNTPLLKKLPLGIGELKSLQTLTRIIIGGNSGFAITELKGLKDLQGEISIEGLNNVQSSIHAREANLSFKGINKLELKWDDGSASETLEKEVLNELKPRSDKLKMLEVECYEGMEFPKWVGDPSFNRLVHVSLRACRKCTSVPPLGRLPSLEILRFEDMSSWEVWSTNSEAMFPCLRELQIKNCPNLIDVSVEALPSLRVLRIYKCCESVLRSLVRAASSTTEIEIGSIFGLTDEVWRGVIENFGAMETVKIMNCDEIRYLWESDAEASKVLTNLKELKVSGCKNLVSLCCPNSIQSLDIRECSSVRDVSFPRATTTGGGGQNLNSLTIDIHVCENLRSINQLSHSTHLTFLIIFKCKIMELFSDLHQLSNLTTLHIQDCESIESFPNLQLPNLTHLDIEDCKNMKAFGDLQLPNLITWSIYNCEKLESFPDLQLSNLTMLTDMCISWCPMIDASFPRGLWPPNLCLLITGRLKSPSQNGAIRISHLPLLTYHYAVNLIIWNFDKLESVSTGLQHLTSLQHLTISFCPKVNDLPETLLRSLLSLRIEGCPKLKERCEGRGSHYWPLISHIPKIEIEDYLKERYIHSQKTDFLTKSPEVKRHRTAIFTPHIGFIKPSQPMTSSTAVIFPSGNLGCIVNSKV